MVKKSNLAVTLALVLLPVAALVGCQTGQRQVPPEPRPAVRDERDPTQVMAGTDAERAKAALEKGKQAQSGERRPFQREERRVVDQPRVEGRR